MRTAITELAGGRELFGLAHIDQSSSGRNSDRLQRNGLLRCATTAACDNDRKRSGSQRSNPPAEGEALTIAGRRHYIPPERTRCTVKYLLSSGKLQSKRNFLTPVALLLVLSLGVSQFQFH